MDLGERSFFSWRDEFPDVMTSVGNADCYLTEMHLDFWTQIGYT